MTALFVITGAVAVVPTPPKSPANWTTPLANVVASWTVVSKVLPFMSNPLPKTISVTVLLIAFDPLSWLIVVMLAILALVIAKALTNAIPEFALFWIKSPPAVLNWTTPNWAAPAFWILELFKVKVLPTISIPEAVLSPISVTVPLAVCEPNNVLAPATCCILA